MLTASIKPSPGPASMAGATLSNPQGIIPSNVSTFLTNLRLLDFDLLPDWPDISSFTFSTRDAGQGQKRRIQCVEWALFHLFALWDPEEARNVRPRVPPSLGISSRLDLRER